jgi:hypothetical protein
MIDHEENGIQDASDFAERKQIKKRDKECLIRSSPPPAVSPLRSQAAGNPDDDKFHVAELLLANAISSGREKQREKRAIIWPTYFPRRQ